MAAPHSNKGMLIPMTAILDEAGSKRSIKELKSLIKQQVIKIRPELATKEFKKELDKIIKDGMKHMSYTLDKNNKISSFSTAVNVSPSQRVSLSAHRTETVRKKNYVDPLTGEKKEIPGSPAHWELRGVTFQANAISTAKLYGNTVKDIIKLENKLEEAKIANNKSGIESLERDIANLEKRKADYQAVLQKDQSEATHQKTLERTEILKNQAAIDRENKSVKLRTRAIGDNYREMERLRKSQLKMSKGSDEYKYAQKRIREIKSDVNRLTGDSPTMKLVRTQYQEKYKYSLKAQTGSDDVAKYNQAMVARLKIEKELASVQMKVDKNKSEDTPETRNYINTLLAEQKLQKEIMDTISEKNKNSAKSVEIADLEAKYTKGAQINAEKLNSENSKSKNILRDIATGWKKAAARVVDYTIAYRTLWYGVSLIKSAIQTIQELNKSFTDIQMVTGMTDREVNRLAESYAKLAQEYGATIQQVAQGATEWLRQGKTASEAGELMKQTLMMSKLGAIDSAKATEYLTSTLNGFGLEARDASKIVDTFSALDMAAATSTEELAIAFQRSANSAKDAGIDFNELAAYITVVSETTRKSASTIGESFKTLAARYMNVKVGVAIDPESGENINDVEKALSTVGIRIRTDQNTWRDFGDVINEIGGNWKYYNEMQKNTITTAMAGVRQAENFRALLNNFEKVGKYTEIAANSAGSAVRKYEVYLDSVEAKTNKLISTFQELAYQPLLVWLYKAILDLTTAFGSLLKVTFDNVGTFSALSAALGMMFLKTKLLSGTALGKTFLNLIDSGKILATRLRLIGLATDKLTLKTIAATIASKALWFAMSPAALAAVAVGIGVVAYALNENAKSLEKSKEELEKLNGELDEYKNRLSDNKDELSKLLELQGTDAYTQKVKDRIVQITKENERLAKQIELRERLIALQQKEVDKGVKDKLGPTKTDKNYYDTSKTGGFTVDPQGDFAKLEKKISQVRMLEYQIQQIENNPKLTREQKDTKIAGLDEQVRKLEEDILILNDTIQENATGLSGASEENQAYKQKASELNDEVYVLTGSTNDLTGETGDLADGMEDVTGQAEAMANTLEGLTSKEADLESVQKEIKDQGYISSETIAKLTKSYPELNSLLMQYQAGVASTTDVIEALQSSYDDDLKEYKLYIAEKNSSDSSFYQKILNDSRTAVDAFSENYGIDLDNFTTLAEAKLAVESALIEELSTMWGEYYNATTDSLTTDYAEKQRNLQYITDPKERQKQLDEMKEIETLLGKRQGMVKEFEDITSGFKTNIQGADDDSGTDAKIEEFNELYRQLQYRRDMNLMSEAEYYDELEKLNKQYFANSKKYLEQYQQYEVEIYQGREQLWKDEFDKRLDNSKKWIERRKELDDWGSDSEILALLRVKAYLEQYYADAKKNHTEYVDDIKAELDTVVDSLATMQNEIIKTFKEGYGESLISDIQDKIDSLENKRLNDSTISRLESQIEAEKERLELLEDQAGEEEKLTAEIQKQKELIAGLQRQKDIRVYSAEKGWTWEQDRQKIVEEQTKLTEMEADLQKEQIQSIIDSLEEKLDDAEKAYDKQIKALQKEKENLEYLSKIRENKEKPTIESVIEKLKTFGTAGEEAAAGLLAWVNDLRKSLGLAPLAIDLGGYKAPPLPAGTKGQTSYGGGGSGSGTAYDSEGKSQTVTIVNGKTQESLPVGTVVKTAGGNFQITGGTPGNYESIRVNDEGGLNTGKGMMLKNVIEPERVLSPQQTKSFESLVRFLPKLKPMMETFSLNPQRQQLAFNASDNSITIQNLNIQAPNGATLQSLLLEAKNIAKINKR